jgi:hypothetical protein
VRLSSILAAGMALLSVSTQAATVLNRPLAGEPESIDPQMTTGAAAFAVRSSNTP